MRMLHEIGSRQNPIGASQADLRRASFRSRFEPIRVGGFRAAGNDRAPAAQMGQGAMKARWVCGPYRCWWRPGYGWGDGYGWGGPRWGGGYGWRRNGWGPGYGWGGGGWGHRHW